MLPPFKTILLLPLQVRSSQGSRWHLPAEPPGSLAAGFLEDLGLLMNRLGEVRARTASGHSERVAPRTDPWTLPEIRAAFERSGADFVVTGEMIVSEDGFDLVLSLRRPTGEAAWSDQPLLSDGLIRDARLILAANLIAAATGQRKDVRRALLGGTNSFEAYRRVCLARSSAQSVEARLEALDRALALDPDYAEARLLMADVLQELGRRDEARRVLAAVAEQFPRFSWARQRYGVALRVAGGASEAVDEVQAALDTDPDGLTLFHAGLFSEAGGDPNTAALLYDRAVQRGCIDPVLCDKLARLRANAGQPIEAIELWQRARELEPDFDQVLGNLALAHHHAGNADEADRMFDLARTRSPETFTTHANRAVWLQDLGRHSEAVEACGRALEIRPGTALVYNNRGVSRLALGDRRGALEDFEAALSRKPGVELATYVRANLARLARGNARVDEAMRLLSQGAGLVRSGRSKAAVPLLLEALDLYPESAHSWLMLALAYREERNWDQTADALAQVLRLDSRHAGALSERSLALLALGRMVEAVDHARLAVEVEPEDAGLVCNLGLVEMEIGHFGTAQLAFERAQHLDPSDPVIDRSFKELKKRRRKDPRWGSGGWTE